MGIMRIIYGIGFPDGGMNNRDVANVKDHILKEKKGLHSK